MRYRRSSARCRLQAQTDKFLLARLVKKARRLFHDGQHNSQQEGFENTPASGVPADLADAVEKILPGGERESKWNPILKDDR
jgi:hypothetical protein